MNYCEKCRILIEGTPCPRCGYKHVRPPKEDDYVFLAEKQYPWSEVLEGALKDAGIEIAVYGVWKAKIVIGSMHERHNIFVPYGALEQAGEIMAQLFDNINYEENFEWEETET